MRYTRIKALFIKDWKELIHSKQALLPMIIIPVIFVIILPVVLLITTSTDTLNALITGDIDAFLHNIPSQFIPEGYDQTQTLIYAILVYFFAPFFLIIPVMFSSLIASSSFAGEKERKTIEGLLYTPLTDRELILGKILVALVPAIIISISCFIVYTLVVNGLGYSIFHAIFFPTLSWFILIFWLIPPLSFLSLALIIAVSQRAAGMWEAQQISVLLLLPIIGLVVSQALGVLYINAWGIFFAGVIVLAIDYVVYRWILSTFNRERIVTRLT